MIVLCLMILALFPAGVRSDGPDGVEQSILLFSGASSLEELDADELERYLRFLEHPLQLNNASRSRLLSSGLLSAYRVASLMDYRRRCGDVLSFTELAAVDGFGENFTAALRPFVSLESVNIPGRGSPDGHSMEHSFVLRTSYRRSSADDWALSGRYAISIDSRYEAGIALKEAYGSKAFPPESSSFYLSYEGPSRLSTLVLGAFNCRFGQGLALWSGFSPSSLSTASSVSKNPTLISPYRGYDAFSGESSALLGAAASFSFEGRRSSGSLSACVAHPGVGAANYSIYLRSGQFGFTALASATECKASADLRLNLRGVDIFAESAFDFFALRAATVLGLRFSPFPNATAATVLRYYPSDWPDSFSAALRSSSRCRDEHGVSLLMDIYSDKRKHFVNIAADAAFRPSKLQDGFAPGRSVQYRALCMWKWDCLPVLSLSTRADLRFRGWEKYALRANMRSELTFDDGANMLKGRLELVHCRDMSYLCFVEAGRRFLFPGGTELSLYLRQGAFHADAWEDRIYCSQRDVPGSFNVPAMYGRGLWTAFLGGLKLKAGLRLHLYGNMLLYPRKGSLFEVNRDRVGKFELRLQLSADLRHRLDPKQLRQRRPG